MKYLSLLTIVAMLLFFGCNNKNSKTKTMTSPSSTTAVSEDVTMEDVKEIEKVVTKLDKAQEEMDATGDELEALLKELE